MRYRVLDLPPRGAGAFCPLMATNPPSSSWGRVVVEGAPGTLPIPSPHPDYLPPLSVGKGPDTAQGSDVSPDVWAPDIYVAKARNMGPANYTNLAARRQTPIPVPAVTMSTPAVAAIPVMIGRKIGGRTVTPWPRAFQRWPSVTGGGRNSGRGRG